MEATPGSELAERPSVTTPARERFGQEQRDLIRESVAPDLNETQFDLFLELCARWELNPLNGEIYAAMMPGRDGAPKKFTPIVGKDGHLAIAQRYPDFQGIEADVVRERDKFVVRRPGPGLIHVVHEYEMAGATSEEGSLKLRGKIVGAWALVHRRGRQPSYFFASWAEYGSTKNAWRSHPSAMIRKCAVVNALREQFSLSGLYFEGELDRAQELGADAAQPEPAWGEDPAVAARLRRLVDAVNATPGATHYHPGKLRMLLRNAADDDRRALCDQIERELLAAGGKVPEEPQGAPQGEDGGGDAAEVVDAEVVGEEEPAGREPEAAPQGEDGPSEDPDVEAMQSELLDLETALESDEDVEGREQMEQRREELREQLGHLSL